MGDLSPSGNAFDIHAFIQQTLFLSGLYYILHTLLLLIKTSHPVPHCHCHVLILFIGKFQRDVVLVLDVD